MPYRLDTVLKCHMNNLIDSLTFGDRKITSASCSFPLPLGANKPLQSVLNSTLHSKESCLLTPLTPNISQVNQPLSQVAVLRGAYATLANQNSGQLQQPMKKPKTLIDSCQSSLEMLNAFSQAMNPYCVNTNWSVNQACRITPPYPNFFGPSVTSAGTVEEGYIRGDKETIKDVNMLACLGTSTGVGEMIQSLVKWSKKVDIRKHNCFIDSGIEYSEFLEVLESLETVANNYSQKW